MLQPTQERRISCGASDSRRGECACSGLRLENDRLPFCSHSRSTPSNLYFFASQSRIYQWRPRAIISAEPWRSAVSFCVLPFLVDCADYPSVCRCRCHATSSRETACSTCNPAALAHELGGEPAHCGSASFVVNTPLQDKRPRLLVEMFAEALGVFI